MVNPHEVLDKVVEKILLCKTLMKSLDNANLAKLLSVDPVFASAKDSFKVYDEIKRSIAVLFFFERAISEIRKKSAGEIPLNQLSYITQTVLTLTEYIEDVQIIHRGYGTQLTALDFFFNASSSVLNEIDLLLRDSFHQLSQIKEVKEPSRQFAQKFSVAEGKTIRLRVVYNPSIEKEFLSPFPRIAKFAVNKGFSSAGAFAVLDAKIIRAIKSAFKTKSVEDLLGSSFSKDVIVYVVECDDDTGGFMNRVIAYVKYFRKAKRHKEIKIFVGTDEIRFNIGIGALIEDAEADIASLVIHELTHIGDKYSDVEYDSKFFDALSCVRVEGLAVFTECLNDKYYLQSYIKEIKSLKTPIKSIDEFLNIKDGEYSIGFKTFVQLFNKRVNIDVDDVDAFAVYVRRHRDDARVFAKAMRLLSIENFFKKYFGEVGDKSIFSAAMKRKILGLQAKGVKSAILQS